MSQVRPVEPVKLFCGLIVSDAASSACVTEKLAACFGPVDDVSAPVPFDFTDYYGAEMGADLTRLFVSFADLVDPGLLADIKLRTNALEQEFVALVAGAPMRRVNIDPGYVTPAKVVLATTKDFSHRLYLGKGIYAEITLNFRKGELVPHAWTYPDFRSGKYAPFFLEMRRRLMAP